MIKVYDDEGEPVDLSKWMHKEVCPRCEGKGKHVNPNVDGHGITADEMYELGEEFLDDYLSGVYDVICHECGGKNVVDVLDEARLHEERPDLMKLYIEAIQQEDERRSEMAWGY